MSDETKGDPTPVIRAARVFRSSIDRRVVHGTHASYTAGQDLFDALDRFDGKPTGAEQAKMDDETIRSSTERARTT